MFAQIIFGNNTNPVSFRSNSKFGLAWNNKNYLPTAHFKKFLFSCRYDELHDITVNTISSERKSIAVFQQYHMSTTHVARMWHQRLKFEIKVDDVTIEYIHNFVKTFPMLLSTCYIFNVAYTEKSEASLHLIQKLFLETADGVKVPYKILSMISKIKKLLLLT